MKYKVFNWATFHACFAGNKRGILNMEAVNFAIPIKTCIFALNSVATAVV
jgi:hypothetical protein